MSRPALLTLGVTLLLAVCLRAAAEEPSITLHATVSGNQEQPRVMYILPWQSPGDTHFEQGFNVGLSGDLFAPLDRDEFVRQLNYRAQIEGDAAPSNTQETEF